MAAGCILYYVTDRRAFPGDEASRRKSLLAKIAEATRAGVDYIQLREKDLSARELESLAGEAIGIIRSQADLDYAALRDGKRKVKTSLLINSRTDIAIAVGAAGIHLPGGDVPPAAVRAIWAVASETPPVDAVISVACHYPEETVQAASNGATLALFAPVFGKKDAPDAPALGLAELREACAAKIPVLALGGVTLENAQSCLMAGASGISAIRLFQENDIGKVAGRLRALKDG
jgi:thiamine-phosphate pyrophosphorylase